MSKLKIHSKFSNFEVKNNYLSKYKYIRIVNLINAIIFVIFFMLFAFFLYNGNIIKMKLDENLLIFGFLGVAGLVSILALLIAITFNLKYDVPFILDIVNRELEVSNAKYKFDLMDYKIKNYPHFWKNKSGGAYYQIKFLKDGKVVYKSRMDANCFIKWKEIIDKNA